MNILITVDKQTSAIGKIAYSIAKYNPHHNVKVLPVHPKRPSDETLHEWQKLAVWADVLDFQYWKSAVMLLAMFPESRNKPKILTHHNPYDLNKEDWKNFDYLIVKNQTQQTMLPRASIVPHMIDLEDYKFLTKEEYTKEKVVGMVAARIEGKKGIQEVAIACNNLGYKFLLVGRVSKPEYMSNVAKEIDIDFREDLSEEDLIKSYRDMAILVCNSEDNFESGPLPVLEAMATGIPILTREVGLIPDINNGKNMVVRKGAKSDIKDLQTELKDLMESPTRRETIRSYGWETVKNRDDKRVAIMCNKIWHKVLNKEMLVSIIIPTCNRPEVLVDSLAAIVEQDYPSKEVIVVDDGDDSRNETVVREFRRYTRVPIKYIKTNNKGYGLAAARNIGIIESIGDLLVFIDDRLRMKQGTIQTFVDKSFVRKWVWGEKDGTKKGFVENFSSVMRKDVVNGGMFNERITKYGGITQDIRTRFQDGLGFVFEFAPEAKAVAITKSSSRWEKKGDIIESKTLLWKLYDQ